MTPLLLAATGGLFTSLAGSLNIALEGMLLTGAFAAVAATYFTGSMAAGLAAAIFFSILMAALHAFSTFSLRSNVFITGLAVNLMATGLTAVLSQRLFNTRGVVVLPDSAILSVITVPVLKNIPVAAQLFSGHNRYVYTAWILLLSSWIVIYKTPFGYRLRACGSNPQALHSLGINPNAYLWPAFLVSGFFCGIGGSLLSLNLGAYVPNMTAGRGWIALVLIFLGGRRPAGLLIAGFVFGFTEALSNYAQSMRNVPADFILALPYMLTFIAMIFISVLEKRKSRAGN